LLAVLPAFGSRALLKDGRVLEGKLAPIASLSKDPRGGFQHGEPGPQLILMCDDNLRRYFVPKRQVQELREADEGEVAEKFLIPRETRRAGMRVSQVGSIVKIGPFDEFGRREFTIQTDKGPLAVIQQITEITPRWTRLEGYRQIWDQRVATSSIPPDVLRKVIDSQIDPKKVEHRLKVARFYLQCEQYAVAEAELKRIAAEFPEFRQQIDSVKQSLKQLAARQVLAEIRLREQAGQYQTVTALLNSFARQFPSDEIAGEILQEVRERQEFLGGRQQAVAQALKRIAEHMAALPEGQLRQRLVPFQQEITSQLNPNNLDRLSAYQKLSDDKSSSVSEKLALAVSGWLVGSDGATENMTIALSLQKLRDLVRSYLSESVKINRDKVLDEIRALEGAVPGTVAQLLANMKPAMELPPAVEGKEGLYEITIPGVEEEPEFTYLAQLPPEYDPYRRYPTIVTLHGGGTTPAMQVDWWAGTFDEQGRRQGQAARHGYIVIAPLWGKVAQREYGYSSIEHLAVLSSLRDAGRRFAIDTDRVYLSGHSMGGDAAWDIGLAHPDLWAGVIPIAAEADKYVNHYWENARYVPLYIIAGELDGLKLEKNATDLERYMIRGFDVTYAEFHGRGHEHFYDEILNLFDWMGRYKRNFYPRDFECRTMRPWDSFFWWVEVAELPPKLVVEPHQYDARQGKRAAQVDAKVTAGNGVYVRSGAQQVTVWLSPELIDFNRPIDVNVNGSRLRRTGARIEPSLDVLLEDARTRGDRQHPFWAKVTMPQGRTNLAADVGGR
jgi:pimeloyl-ACP methyl ester carboxylesterase